MGTSKGYSAPTTGEWPTHKTQVTIAARNGEINQFRAKNIINSYISANGGAKGIAKGNSSIGRSKRIQKTSQKLASLLNSISTNGLSEALSTHELEHLINKPASEISIAIINEFCGAGSTLDEVDVRNALSDLFDELFSDSETYEDLENILEGKITENFLDTQLMIFFGNYLYHQFCRVHYERLLSHYGEAIVLSFINSIKETIFSLLHNKTYQKDLKSIDWNGDEGETLIEEIIEFTYEIFKG